MDIKQLKFLIALDETRHFGQAAARCHITQPTLSMRLRSLEEELDLPLVNRGQRFEGFTAPGERVLAWARTVLAAYDGLYAEAAACRGNLVGTLRLGVVPLSSFDPLPLMQRLHAEHFDSLSFSETRMGLLYDQRFFTFGETPLSWESLIELPLGMLTSGMHFRQSIDHNFHSRGLTPQPLLQTDAVHQLLQAVHGGLCCAVMPLDGGLEGLTEHLRLQPIENAQTLGRLGLIMRRSAPRSALAEACFALYQQSLIGG